MMTQDVTLIYTWKDLTVAARCSTWPTRIRRRCILAAGVTIRTPTTRSVGCAKLQLTYAFGAK